MHNAQAIAHSAYLDALGIDQYVSRKDLAGAAPSRREAMPQPLAKSPRQASAGVALESPQAPPSVDRRPPGRSERSKVTAAPASANQPVADAAAVPTPRFSLAAIVAGPFLWLEDAPGSVVAREQVNLIRGMARALGAVGNKPRVAQFDWPLNNNRQLDQSAAAASAALESFVLGQVERQGCQAVILLGTTCQQYLPEWAPQSLHVVTTAGTRQMQSEPGIKQQVWQDLRALRFSSD